MSELIESMAARELTVIAETIRRRAVLSVVAELTTLVASTTGEGRHGAGYWSSNVS